MLSMQGPELSYFKKNEPIFAIIDTIFVIIAKLCFRYQSTLMYICIPMQCNLLLYSTLTITNYNENWAIMGDF